MPITLEILQALRRILPNEPVGSNETIASIITSVLDQQNVDKHDLDHNQLIQLLLLLAGHSIATSQSVISFGESNNLGDITIGDVAGGNITKISVHIDSHKIDTKRFYSHDDSEIQHKIRLISIHRQRLYVLEEQAAAFGLSCPPHILIEIDEINNKITQIYRNISQ